METTQHTIDGASAIPTGHGDASDIVHAGFWRRWGALFLDQLILGAAFYAVLLLLIVGAGIAGGFSWLGQVDTDSPPAALVAAYFGLFGLYYIAAGLYFALMESSSRQATLGKMALGIKTVDEKGGRLSFGRALGRWVAATLSYLTLYIGFLMAAFTERKRALHDMVAGTLVVDRWAYTDRPELQRRELGGCLLAIIAAAVLMVIVAVLGILAAIAIPAYQDYTLRAEVARVSADVAPLRQAIAGYLAEEGRCPDGDDLGPGATGVPHGGLVERIQVGEFDDGACGLEVRLASSGRAELNEGRLWWQLGPDGRWQCSSSMDNRWLPQECRD